MASFLSRLINTLRDIRIPFPMTQAPAAPSVSAIADPATGTVDISGIIYQLESLVTTYQGVLKQATEQLQNLEIPEDVKARLARAARDAAHETITAEARNGTLMDDAIRREVQSHVNRKLDDYCDFLDAPIERYVDSRSDVVIRGAVYRFNDENEDRLVESASRRVDRKVASVESNLDRDWSARIERLVSDRVTLKQSLLTLLGDDMRELAREILADERNNQATS